MRVILTILASLLLMGLIIIGFVLYIAFGPRSIILGILLGAAITLGLIWLGFKLPRRAPIRFGRAAATASDDGLAGSNFVTQLLGWCLTILSGALTIAAATAAIALWLRDELSSGMTAAAVLCGVFLVLTAASFKFVARA